MVLSALEVSLYMYEIHVILAKSRPRLSYLRGSRLVGHYFKSVILFRTQLLQLLLEANTWELYWPPLSFSECWYRQRRYSRFSKGRWCHCNHFCICIIMYYMLHIFKQMMTVVSCDRFVLYFILWCNYIKKWIYQFSMLV